MTGNPHNDPVGAGIQAILNYFGLFKYPLLPEEIHRYHPTKCSLHEVENRLLEMQNTNEVVCSVHGFFSLEKQEAWSTDRLKGNEKALQMLARSLTFTRIISAFPFVEAIAISGSLSKYYAGKDADFDFFIITTKNRLWTSRTLLHLFKKFTFLVGYQHCFCMNYFVDTDGMEITDQNLYTAIELATLIPTYNAEQISHLVEQNRWYNDFLPNSAFNPELNYLYPKKNGWGKKLLEWMLNMLSAERMNLFFMNLTDRKWRKKWQKRGFPMEDYDRAFYTSLHQSKNHPADFQKKILHELEINRSQRA